MNRDDVLALVEQARKAGDTPDLRSASLIWADLRWANLRNADLRGSKLRHADLRHADLRDADLRDADLRDANLGGSDLRDASLWGADLHCADLRWADLNGVSWDGLVIDGLPSGKIALMPTSEGWEIHVGCWRGTPDELRTLIARDEGWPEAEGDEIVRRRPLLEAALALCEAHMQAHPDAVDAIIEAQEKRSNDKGN